MILNYITEEFCAEDANLICRQQQERGGRQVDKKYGVKLLNKDMKNNDQSKAKHGAELEKLKGKKIQKGGATGLRACQDKDTKQKTGNSLMKILHFVRNDKITASQKYKILVVAFFFSLNANTSQLYFPQDIHTNPLPILSEQGFLNFDRVRETPKGQQRHLL